MTSTTIEERIRLRMRGGPPWGFRVEGSTAGPVYISSLRQRSSGKEQQIQLGDEVVSINGRGMQGISGDVAMAIVENSVGILELEIMRKRYEDSPVTDYTSSAYSHPKIQSPQPTYQQPQVYQPAQPTYQQPHQNHQPYQNSYPQPYQPQETYQNQPYTSYSPSQPSSYQSHPGYQAAAPYQTSHSSIQPHVTSTMHNHAVQHRPSTVQVSQTNDNNGGGGLSIKKKTTTTTRVLTKTGGDKSEKTVTKTVTERVGNQETTTTIKETQKNDGYGEEVGPKTVVKETRYTDKPVEDLMEVAPASQSHDQITRPDGHDQMDSYQPAPWTKKTPPWEAQRKKRPVPPPPKPKPKPRVLPPTHTAPDMDRFQPIRFSPSGSPAGSSTPTNYNSKPRGWNSPRNSIDNTPTSPRSVESGNAGDFRSQPLVQEQQRKGSDGFVDFNARPKGFHPSNYTPRAGMVE